METDRLKQFCGVVETQSLTRAAEISGITLSGLSRSMKILQAELAQELFRQHGRGIIVTDQGLQLYRKAKEVLERVALLSKVDRPIRTFRLGALEVFTYNIIGRIADPDWGPLKILEEAPRQLELRILNDELDCGLTYLPFGMDGIEHLPVTHFHLKAFVRIGTFANLLPKFVPFIVPSGELSASPLGTKERDGWPEELWDREVRAHVNLLSTAIDLCCQGQGSVFMPDFVGNEHNMRSSPDFKLTPLKLPIGNNQLKRTLFLAKRVSSPETQEMKRITAKLRRVIK